MKFPRIALLIVSVVTLSCLAGCSKAADNTLVGKWKNQSLPEIVEFKGDHTGIFLVKDSPSLPFIWSTLNNTSVKIEIPYKGQISSLSGSVEKNTFTLNGRAEQAVYVKME